MASMNQVVLIGRVAKQPELRYTQAGKATCSFRLAVDRKGKAADGESNADFVPISCWERLAEICNEYLTLGKLISVVGRLSIRSYEKDGQRQTWTEVVIHEMQMLESGEKKEAPPKYPPRQSAERSGNAWGDQDPNGTPF